MEHFTVDSSNSSSRCLQGSLLAGSVASARRLNTCNVNYDLSPTPIDPSRINIVDHVPLHSLILSQDETVSEMLIGLLRGPLPHGNRHLVSWPVLSESSLPGNGKIEHSILGRQDTTLGIYPLKPMALKKTPPPTAKEGTPQRRPHTSDTSTAAPSDMSASGQPKPAFQSLKEKRFRPLKSGQWFEKLSELAEYTSTFGHCHVPHNWKENLSLAQWVKRQRYQVRRVQATASYCARIPADFVQRTITKHEGETRLVDRDCLFADSPMTFLTLHFSQYSFVVTNRCDVVTVQAT
jgi:Helicase associated domain